MSGFYRVACANCGEITVSRKRDRRSLCSASPQGVVTARRRRTLEFGYCPECWDVEGRHRPKCPRGQLEES